MQEEFNEKVALKPPGKPPEDVVCVIDVRAVQMSQIEEPIRGVDAAFRCLLGGSLWRKVAGSGGTDIWNRALALDYSTVPQALQVMADFNEQAAACLKPAFRLSAPEEKKGFRVLHGGKTETQIWLGSANQFQPCPSYPGRRIPKEGGEQPYRLEGPDITAEQLKTALGRFYTREAHAENALRFEKATKDAVELPDNINVRRPLRFRK